MACSSPPIQVLVWIASWRGCFSPVSSVVFAWIPPHTVVQKNVSWEKWGLEDSPLCFLWFGGSQSCTTHCCSVWKHLSHGFCAAFQLFVAEGQILYQFISRLKSKVLGRTSLRYVHWSGVSVHFIAHGSSGPHWDRASFHYTLPGEMPSSPGHPAWSPSSLLCPFGSGEVSPRLSFYWAAALRGSYFRSYWLPHRPKGLASCFPRFYSVTFWWASRTALTRW